MAATKALDELGHLECWVIKQADLTSSALGDLLPEEKITRQAMLQNCAAIDFLLLAHRRGCQDFEGKCCFNLSSKSESIHATLAAGLSMVSVKSQGTGEKACWKGV